jgi:peptide chain release factor subunit 1
MSDESSIRDRIETVASVEADDDQLVTVAVPPDGSLPETRERVAEDRAEASYIDDGASKPYQRAIDAAHDRLQAYDAVPANGLVVYAGVDDDAVFEATFDDLPDPVDEHVYEVANRFDTTPLDAAVTGTTDDYGLVVVERGGAVLGRYAGETVTLLEQLDSDVRGKTRKGGQSEERFERRREEQKREFFETVADAASRTFTADSSGPARPGGSTEGTEWEDDDGDGVDHLLVGGTTVTVDEFVDGEHLDADLADRVVGTYSVEYASEQGLRELVDAASDDREGTRAHEALSSFLAAVGGDDPVAYGHDEVDDALAYEAVETLVVSAALAAAESEGLADRAREQGGEVVVVPAETEDGQRFRDAFDGVGAHLRFPID